MSTKTDDLITIYESEINQDFQKLEKTVRKLASSKDNAYNRAKSFKTALITIGIFVGIIGVILPSSEALGIPNNAKKWISFSSAVFGFATTFITANFDPAKFRERTIVLNDLIYDFTDTLDVHELELKKIQIIQVPEEKLSKIEELETRVRTEKSELMKRASSLKTSIDDRLVEEVK